MLQLLVGAVAGHVASFPAGPREYGHLVNILEQLGASGAMTDMDVGRVMAKLVGRQVVAGQLHGVKARLAVCPAGDHNRQRWILMSVL